MKTNGKYAVIAQIAGRGLVLAALLGGVFFTPDVSRAQSSATSPAAAAAKPAVAQPTSKALPAPKPPAKGEHEGITVHGHWTIEVRNPDGTLVTHREFENSLVGSGAQLLTGLLGRTTVTGSWEIILATSSASMHITEPNSTQASICSYAACANNLSVVAGTSQSPGTLTFAGFVAVPAGQTSIIQVQTDNIACGPSVLPAACVNTLASGVNTGTSTDFGLTQATLSPAISITPARWFRRP